VQVNALDVRSGNPPEATQDAEVLDDDDILQNVPTKSRHVVQHLANVDPQRGPLPLQHHQSVGSCALVNVAIAELGDPDLTRRPCWQRHQQPRRPEGSRNHQRSIVVVIVAAMSAIVVDVDKVMNQVITSVS
jgi:hypothetical protein